MLPCCEKDPWVQVLKLSAMQHSLPCPFPPRLHVPCHPGRTLAGNEVPKEGGALQ